MIDVDRRCWCGICGGPVYYDEPGSRCPDCWAVLQSIENVNREDSMLRTFDPSDGWKANRDERDLNTVLPSPVLYGLLTADDVAELERRRLLFGLVKLESAVLETA